MATKQQTDLYIKVGVIIGAYFLIVKPILEKLGISKTPGEEQTIKDIEFNSSNINSPFSPRYNDNQKKPYFIIKAAVLKNYLSGIYEALNKGFFGDDINAIYAIFRQLKYKTQVSYLADEFYKTFKIDLLETIKNGIPGSLNPRAGLSNEELAVLFDIVKNLK
jgi:hypothetical protein